MSTFRLIALSFLPLLAPAADPKLELVSVRKIWDKLPHNAFGDLIRYQDRGGAYFVKATGTSHRRLTARPMASCG